MVAFVIKCQLYHTISLVPDIIQVCKVSLYAYKERRLKPEHVYFHRMDIVNSRIILIYSHVQEKSHV